MERDAHLLPARDFMRPSVFSLSPDHDVYDAAMMLLKRKFSGAPVVDGERTLLGVFTEADCLRVLSTAAFDVAPTGHVRDHMTTDVITVEPETDIFTVVARMKDGARRLPVVDDGKLVGLVTRTNILEALVEMEAEREKERKDPGMYDRSRSLKRDGGSV